MVRTNAMISQKPIASWSQSPQSGAMVRTQLEELVEHAVLESQSPQSGAMVRTKYSELLNEMKVLVSIPSKRGNGSDRL